MKYYFLIVAIIAVCLALTLVFSVRERDALKKELAQAQQTQKANSIEIYGECAEVRFENPIMYKMVNGTLTVFEPTIDDLREFFSHPQLTPKPERLCISIRKEGN